MNTPHEIAMRWLLGEAAVYEVECAFDIDDDSEKQERCDEVCLCELGEDAFYSLREEGDRRFREWVKR